MDLRDVETTNLTSPQGSGAAERSTETLNSKVNFISVRWPLPPTLRRCLRRATNRVFASLLSSCDPNDGSSEGEERVGLLHLHGRQTETRPGADLPTAAHREDHSR